MEALEDRQMPPTTLTNVLGLGEVFTLQNGTLTENTGAGPKVLLTGINSIAAAPDASGQNAIFALFSSGDLQEMTATSPWMHIAGLVRSISASPDATGRQSLFVLYNGGGGGVDGLWEFGQGGIYGGCWTPLQSGVRAIGAEPDSSGNNPLFVLYNTGTLQEFNQVSQWATFTGGQLARDSSGTQFLRVGTNLVQMNGPNTVISGVQGLYQMVDPHGNQHAYYLSAGQLYEYDSVSSWVAVTGANQVARDCSGALFVLTNGNLVQMSGSTNYPFLNGTVTATNVQGLYQMVDPQGNQHAYYLSAGHLYEYDSVSSWVGVTGANQVAQDSSGALFVRTGSNLVQMSGAARTDNWAFLNGVVMARNVVAIGSSTSATGQAVVDVLGSDGSLSQWNNGWVPLVPRDVTSIAQGSDALGRPLTYYLANNGYVYPDLNPPSTKQGYLVSGVTALAASTDGSGRAVVDYLIYYGDLRQYNGQQETDLAPSGVTSIAQGSNALGRPQVYYLWNLYAFPDLTSPNTTTGFLRGNVKAIASSTSATGQVVVDILCSDNDGWLLQWNYNGPQLWVTLASSGVQQIVTGFDYVTHKLTTYVVKKDGSLWSYNQDGEVRRGHFQLATRTDNTNKGALYLLYLNDSGNNGSPVETVPSSPSIPFTPAVNPKEIPLTNINGFITIIGQIGIDEAPYGKYLTVFGIPVSKLASGCGEDAGSSTPLVEAWDTNGNIIMCPATQPEAAGEAAPTSVTIPAGPLPWSPPIEPNQSTNPTPFSPGTEPNQSTEPQPITPITSDPSTQPILVPVTSNPNSPVIPIYPGRDDGGEDGGGD